MKRTLTSLCLVTVLFLTGCDNKLLVGFKIAVSAASPFVQRLVTKGVLSQELAANIKTDLNDVVDVSIRLNDRFKEAGSDKVAKANAASRAVSDYAAIIARGHFVTNPLVNEIAMDIGSILDGIAVFYGGTPSAPQAPAASAGELKKQIEAKIKALDHKLKQ